MLKLNYVRYLELRQKYVHIVKEYKIMLGLPHTLSFLTNRLLNMVSEFGLGGPRYEFSHPDLFNLKYLLLVFELILILVMFIVVNRIEKYHTIEEEC